MPNAHMVLLSHTGLAWESGHPPPEASRSAPTRCTVLPPPGLYSMMMFSTLNLSTSPAAPFMTLHSHPSTSTCRRGSQKQRQSATGCSNPAMFLPSLPPTPTPPLSTFISITSSFTVFSSVTLLHVMFSTSPAHGRVEGGARS